MMVEVRGAFSQRDLFHKVIVLKQCYLGNCLMSFCVVEVLEFRNWMSVRVGEFLSK